MASSYDYVDEFTKQLARKRRLAELLQQQSMSGLQLPNPNARGSWLNALVPIAQAYFGNKMADQANAEGTAHQAELAQQTKDAIAQFTQGTQGLPERPDMNLPGDLSGLADATTRPSTDVQSPLLPPSQQPQNPMAQLLAGNATPTLGDKLAADQGQPTVAPKDLTPMLPGTVQPGDAPTTPPLVPQPPTRINIGGVSPAQAARDEAIVKADMAKSGLAGSPIVRGPAPPEEQAAATAGEIPPMPPQAPAPPPSLAGPVTPGALPAPPGTPPPSLIPTLPNGQPDMAPKGQMLPAQPGKTPNAFDMLNFAASLPQGSQQAHFMSKALDTALTEPGRLEAKRQHDELLAALGGAKIASAEKQTAQRVEGAGQRADVRAASNERIADVRARSAENVTNLRLAGGVQGYGKEYDQLPARQQAVVDFYATQQIGGDNTWRTGLGRTASGSALIKAVDERVPTMATDLNLTASDIGTNRAVRVASQSALTQLTKDVSSIEPFAKMLDQNADILKGLATKIIKTQSPLANKPINWLMDNAAGDPDVAEYLAQMRLVQTEAARVIVNPRLVGQLTDTSQRELEHILNGSMSLDATNQVLDRLKNDSQRRVSLMKQQQEDITGRIKGMMEPKASTAPSTKKVIRFDAQGNELP